MPYLNELIENQADVIEALREADHFYICHYCKKRDQIEHRRCFWDSKSKIWETKNGKLAVTCVAMDNEEHTIVGYRTFTDIFNITGRVAKFPTSEAVQCVPPDFARTAVRSIIQSLTTLTLSLAGGPAMKLN